MSTTATVVLVAGVGAAVFFYVRSQQQQSSALAVAAAGGGATAGTGGGVGGLAQRVWTQWKGDPLGIKNTTAALGTAKTVVSNAANEVGGVVHSIGSAIGGLF